MSMNNKPSVFISFNNKSRDFVDCLEGRLSKVANVLRYEAGVGPWGSFSDFMNTVKDQDFAVLVLSDEYLKSYACMYEVIQAMKNPNWKDKVIIALMQDVKPYKDDERIKYIQFWHEQYEDICKKLEGLNPKSIEKMIAKRDMYRLIRDSIDEFLHFVADSNCPPIYNVIQEICERVKISPRAVFKYTDPSGEHINMRMLCVLDFIKENPHSSIINIVEGVGISRKSAAYYLNKLIEQGMVVAVKAGNTKIYDVLIN